MPATRRPRHLLYPLGCTLALLGCSSGPSPSDAADSGSRQRGDIVALIDGRPIGPGDLDPILREQGGAAALAEIALDRAIERQLRSRGIELTPADIDREQETLLAGFAGLSEDVPQTRLIAQLRAARGLGPERYARLLRRNAALRALVTGAEPGPREEELARAIAFGPSYRVRLFVSRDETMVARLREELLASEPEARRWVLADAAARGSIHPSSARGGLIERLSPADPQYPAGITEALATTPVGEVSPSIATDAGHTLLLVEAQSDGSQPTPEQLAQVRTEITQRKQRLAMERLAEELLGGSDVVVMDRALKWSWDNRP